MSRTRLLLVTAVLQALPTPAAAQITLIDQIPQTPDFGVSYLSDSQCSGVTFAVAEDFSVSEPVTIDSIVLWGGYSLLAAPSDPETFVIRIHQDASGLPGAVLAERAPAVSQSLLLVEDDDDIDRSLYEFTATFAPIPLEPGIYWAEIVETDSTTVECFQWRGSFQDELHSANGLAFNVAEAGWELLSDGPGQADEGLAIRIIGTPATAVPVLDRFALGLLALVLVTVAARRILATRFRVSRHISVDR